MKALILAIAICAAVLPSSALACGYKYDCKPKPIATPVATPLVTPTPAPPPPTPVPTPVIPVATPVPVVIVQQLAPPLVQQAISPAVNESASESKPGEYCVYEVTTGNFEIRRSTDTEKFIRSGAERPIAPHVCDQHPAPVVSVVVASSTPQPTMEEVVPEQSIMEEQPPAEAAPTQCWQLDESGEVAFFEDGTPVPCSFEWGIPPEWIPAVEDTTPPVQLP